MLRIRLAVTLSVPLMALSSLASAQMRPVDGAEIPDHILAPADAIPATSPATDSGSVPLPQAALPAIPAPVLQAPSVPATAVPDDVSSAATLPSPNLVQTAPVSGTPEIPAADLATVPAAPAAEAPQASALPGGTAAPVPGSDPAPALPLAQDPGIAPALPAAPKDTVIATEPTLAPSGTPEAATTPLIPIDSAASTGNPPAPSSTATDPVASSSSASRDGVLAPPLPPDDHALAATLPGDAAPSIIASASSPEPAAGVRLPPPPKGKTPNGRVRDLPELQGGSRFRPFTHFGLAAKADSLGVGGELATVLSRSLNLRVGASLANLGYAFALDGINYNTGSHLKSGTGSIDWFPMHGGFHISPGVLYLETSVGGSAGVPAGHYFSLGNTNYVNSIDDPVGGTATLKYDRKISPMLLIGSGNLIPRSGRHLTVPFEIGAAYTGQAVIDIKLAGTACTTGGCFSAATDPQTQSNLHQELTDINSHLKPYPFYPIVSLGLGYRF